MKIKKSEIKANNDGYFTYYTYNGIRLFGYKILQLCLQPKMNMIDCFVQFFH